MRRVFGPRTVVEIAFLVAVPVVSAVLGAGKWTIIAASAVAYLLIFVLEATLWREGRPAPALSRMRLPARNVVVKRPDDPALAPAQAGDAEAVVVQRPVAAPPPAPAPPQTAEHVRVLRREPEPPPEPEPEPAPVAERAPLAAVPEPEPVPEPVPAPAPPAPEPRTVVPIGVGP